mgnify:CR=1 FL=1
MEHVAVTNLELEALADQFPSLTPYFVGVFAADTLPSSPVRSRPQAYIVNTDPKDQPGRHWIALWTEGDACEKMDSYGLPIQYYNSVPLERWLATHWHWMDTNRQSLQSLHSATCGHYALKYCVDKSQGKTLRDFLNQFTSYDYVTNDARIARWMKQRMLKLM